MPGALWHQGFKKSPGVSTGTSEIELSASIRKYSNVF
jgi:hypothetical protein